MSCITFVFKCSAKSRVIFYWAGVLCLVGLYCAKYAVKASWIVIWCGVWTVECRFVECGGMECSGMKWSLVWLAWKALQNITVNCNALQCKVEYWREARSCTVWCSSTQCRVQLQGDDNVEWFKVKWKWVDWIIRCALWYFAVLCRAGQCSAVLCCALHFARSSLPCIAWTFNAAQNRTLLQKTTQHRTTQHIVQKNTESFRAVYNYVAWSGVV